MTFLNHKGSTEKRERPDYNGAVTALTDEEWRQLAERRHDSDGWVLTIDGNVSYASPDWTTALGAFYLNTRSGKRVVMTSAEDHADYLRRLAEAVLAS